jgi:hypothetical protein
MKRNHTIALLIALGAAVVVFVLISGGGDRFFKGDYYGITWGMSAKEVLQSFQGKVVSDTERGWGYREIVFEHEDRGMTMRSSFEFDQTGALKRIGVEPGAPPTDYVFKMLERLGIDAGGLSEDAAVSLMGNVIEEMRKSGDMATWREAWAEVFEPQIKAFQVYSTGYTNRLVKKYGEWTRIHSREGQEFTTTEIQWKTPGTTIDIIMGVNGLIGQYLPVLQ